MKEGETAPTRMTGEELTKICSILATAEYCCETVQWLEDKLKEKAGPTLFVEIDFAAEQEVFNT